MKSIKPSKIKSNLNPSILNLNKGFDKTSKEIPKTLITSLKAKKPPDKVKTKNIQKSINSDMYNGLCVIHAHYEGLIDTDIHPEKSISTDQKISNLQDVCPTISPESESFSSDNGDNGDNGDNCDNYDNGDNSNNDISNSGDDSNIDTNTNEDDDLSLSISTVESTDKSTDKSTVESTDESTSLNDVDKLQQGVEKIKINNSSKKLRSPQKVVLSKYKTYNYTDNDKLCNDFIHDFSNTQPEKIRTLRGAGFVRMIHDTYYVVTCNHILVKYAKYRGYCLNTDNIIVEFDMMIYCRIPELDIVILTITSPISTPLTIISLDTEISDMYQKDKNNSIVTGEYKPISISTVKSDPLEIQSKVKHVDIPINNNIQLIFEQLSSKHIHHIPLLNIPVEELAPVKSFITDYKLDLHNELKEHTKRREFISRTISDKVAGLSGSLVRSEGRNIGMVCMYTDTNNGLFIKAVPMFLINLIVENAVVKNIKQIMGVQIDTHPCTIDYESKRISGHYVIRDTCSYINGRRLFNFSKGDIVLEIDGHIFNDSKLLWSDVMNMYIPLNTYMMIRSNIDPFTSINVKIAKQISDDIKSRSYNIKCTPYNDMYRTRITERTCRWENMIFIELSEDVLLFYKLLGIDIMDTTGGFDKYSTNNEKIIILLNYDKQIPDTSIQTKTYIDMVQKGTSGVNFFYILNHIGHKKITNMDDLMLTISTLKKHNKKAATLKLSNDIGIIKPLKINLK